jgi:phage host-nuclease inhibitor protein Gam
MNTNNEQTQPAITPIQFEQAMEQYAAAERREQELNEAMTAQVGEVMRPCQSELAFLGQARQAAFATARAFCEQNKASLFKSRRSIGTLHGIAGFRLGTPRLKTADDTDWKQVLAILKEQLPDYVRTTEEPARDMLLTHRHKEQVAPVLLQAGVHVVQQDIFYIDSSRAADAKPQKKQATAQPLTPTITVTKKAA